VNVARDKFRVKALFILETIILLDKPILVSVIVIVLLEANSDRVELMRDTTKLSVGESTLDTICN
jgi:hypothetical protein